MADFDDLPLERSAAPPPPPQPRWLVILAATVLLIALLALWYYLRQAPDRDPPVETTESAVARTAVTEPGAPAADLPPLDASDAFVREMMRTLSEHPVIASWLTTDQLIRNFTVSVVNVADGDTPARHLHTIGPDQKFAVRRDGTRTVIDPQSYRRFDRHASAAASVDAAGAARLYRLLQPRIEEAYKEVAGPTAAFDRTLERAIVELLRAPVVEGPIAVEQRVAGYAYADPSLESLSRAQRQLVRMGPENVRAIQQKLRDIARHLGIDEASLPEERVIRLP